MSGPDSHKIIFVSGWGNTVQVFEPLRQALGGDSECWCLPGHGDDRTGYDESLNGRSHWEGLVDLWVERLPPSCVLVGWSLGGMLAIALAARVPQKVKGLICLAASPSFVARDDWPEGLAMNTFKAFDEGFIENPRKAWRRFLKLQLLGDDNATHDSKVWLRDLPAPKEHQLSWWQAGLNWLQSIDLRILLPQLTCPVLHVFGDQDQLVGVEQVADLEVLLVKSEKQKITILEGASHLFPLTYANQLSETIQVFLKGAALSCSFFKQRIASSFGRAAESYDAVADIQYQSASQLLQLLPEIPQEVVLDLGAGTGFLARLYPSDLGCEQFISLDLSDVMLRMANGHMLESKTHQCVNADFESLPFARSSVSLVLSNFALQWCGDLPLAFRQVRDVLQPGGSFLFSLLGHDTLSELRWAWAQVDSFVHVNNFADGEYALAALEGSGFEVQAHDREYKKVDFKTLPTLLRSLKAVGARNMNAGQAPGLKTRSKFEALARAYETLRDSQGCLPLTYETHFFKAILK